MTKHRNSYSDLCSFGIALFSSGLVRCGGAKAIFRASNLWSLVSLRAIFIEETYELMSCVGALLLNKAAIPSLAPRLYTRLAGLLLFVIGCRNETLDWQVLEHGFRALSVGAGRLLAHFGMVNNHR